MKAIILTLLFSLFFNLAHADIRPEHSGTWYNPDQAGHGLAIQVLDDERTIAFWFAFTPEGLPMFLVIDGVNEYHSVTGPAYYQEGMIWRQFDPSKLNSEVWGDINIEFFGCNSAILNWSSSDPRYGAGQVELQRLTYLAGLECDEVAAELMGEWQVRVDDGRGNPYPEAGGPYPVTINANGEFAFDDVQGCRWEGHIHVLSMERGSLTGRFGSPTCPGSVPMLVANGRYYANGISFCSSGGSCVSFDQAIGLQIYWWEVGTIHLTFVR